jgi:hypothetical protein
MAILGLENLTIFKAHVFSKNSFASVFFFGRIIFKWDKTQESIKVLNRRVDQRNTWICKLGFRFPRQMKLEMINI